MVISVNNPPIIEVVTGRMEVQDDGYPIIGDADTLNFTDNLTVTTDGYGTAIVSVNPNLGRYILTIGFDGTATTGRYLEFVANNNSFNNPYVSEIESSLVGLAIECRSNSTGTVSILQNGSPIETISLSTARKNIKSNLNYTFFSLDELSAQVTSGSLVAPNVYINMRSIS